MDFFESYKRRQRSMNFSAVLNFTPLSTPQKKHLSRVYSMIGLGVCVTALGVYFQNQIMRIHFLISLLANVGFLMAVAAGTVQARSTGKAIFGNRFLYYSGFTFTMGTTIGDLVAMAGEIDPAIPMHAFIASLAIFGCFSAAAMLAKRRTYLFLGTILAASMSYFTMVSFANIFFRSAFVHNVVLYGTLLAYMGFVVYDTQVTIAEFDAGNSDYLMQAITLYVDFVGIFIRLLVIMMEKEEKKKRNKR